MFNQYILILLWIGLMGMLVGNFYRIEYNSLTGEDEWRVKPLFAFVVMMPVIWMATNRGWFGDSGLYIAFYREMPSSFSEIGSYMVTVTKDRGFYLFSAVLRVLLGDDFKRYFFVMAFIQAIVVVSFFRKYTSAYIFAIFLFVASTDYTSWMFNGVRQFFAVIMVLCATPYVLRQKYIKAFVIVLLASAFHQSALIMLPIIVIVQGKVWNKKTLMFIAMSLLAIAFVERFTGLLDSSLVNTQYVNVVTDYTEWQDNGTNPIRVLIYSIPAVLSFFGRKRIEEYEEPIVNLSVNMSIVSMGLYLISMVTSGIFLGRLPIYVSLYSYILLPWEIEHLFGENTQKLIKGSAIVAYIGFYIYAMHFQNALI